MLTLPSVISTDQAKPVRSPKAGFELLFSVPIRIATDSLTFNGLSFSKAGLEVKSFKTGKGGIQAGRIEFMNPSFTFTNIIFAELYSVVKVNGYLWWGDGPFILGDEIKFFAGEIIAVPKVYDTIILEVATIAQQAREIPRYTASPPEVNFQPYPGQKYVWEGETYKVTY